MAVMLRNIKFYDSNFWVVKGQFWNIILWFEGKIKIIAVWWLQNLMVLHIFAGAVILLNTPVHIYVYTYLVYKII